MSLVAWELWCYVQVPVVWYLFRRFAGRDVTGHMIAGIIMGINIEFLTEPLWDYHFALTVYQDTPPAIVLGWGVMFTLVTCASERLYCLALGRRRIMERDPRLLLFDAAAAILIAFPLETLGLKSGIYTYRLDLLQWDWGAVPLFHMPYEALMGYVLLMLLAPTCARFWERLIQRRGHVACFPPTKALY